MNMDELQRQLSLEEIRKKILKIKDMYIPKLVSNLSKEAYDIYLARKSISEDLLTFLEGKDINLGKAKDYIKNKIKENKEKLKKAYGEAEINFIKITIKEWEDFL